MHLNLILHVVTTYIGWAYQSVNWIRAGLHALGF